MLNLIWSKLILHSCVHTFDVFLKSLNTNGIHIYEFRCERWNLVRVHSESVVHHENMTVCELAATDSDGGCGDFFCDFRTEFFGNVLEDHFEATETVNVLGRLFDGASFFFGSAFLLEVFGGLR